MNLTDRQEQLIFDLLKTYAYLCNDIAISLEEVTPFTFMGECYDILDSDYDNVCEIIDYIKGVKK